MAIAAATAAVACLLASAIAVFDDTAGFVVGTAATGFATAPLVAVGIGGAAFWATGIAGMAGITPRFEAAGTGALGALSGCRTACVGPVPAVERTTSATDGFDSTGGVGAEGVEALGVAAFDESGTSTGSSEVVFC